MKGWMGKILRVDLTRAALHAEPLDPVAAKDYIGGRGLGIHFLQQEVDPLCDPLAADNLLIMATGSSGSECSVARVRSTRSILPIQPFIAAPLVIVKIFVSPSSNLWAQSRTFSSRVMRKSISSSVMLRGGDTLMVCPRLSLMMSPSFTS